MNYEPLQELIRQRMQTVEQHNTFENAKEARDTISKATESRFQEMMKPLVAERKRIMSKIDGFKKDLSRAKQPTEIDASKAKLNRAKTELRRFDKAFISRGREIRAQVAAKARKENPLAAKVAAEYKSRQKTRTARSTREYSRSR